MPGADDPPRWDADLQGAGSGAVGTPPPLCHPEQAVAGAPDDAVALAGDALQAGAVGDLDTAFVVADEARFLQGAPR